VPVGWVEPNPIKLWKLQRSRFRTGKPLRIFLETLLSWWSHFRTGKLLRTFLETL